MVTETKGYCPICGKSSTDPAFERFGEIACSQEHADQYIQEVRSQRQNSPDERDTRYSRHRDYGDDFLPRRRGGC